MANIRNHRVMIGNRLRNVENLSPNFFLTSKEKDILFGMEFSEFKRRLRREMNKHPRHNIPSRERTTSSRKRAGSKKGNRHHTVKTDIYSK